MKRFMAVGFVAVLGVVFAAPAGASDKSTAKKLVITKADVGTGYVAAKGTSDPKGFEKIVECVGDKSAAKRKVVARADGPDLQSANGKTQVQSNVDIVKTKAMAKADRAVLASDDFPGCYEDLVEERGGASITSIDLQRAEVTEFGDYATALLASIELDRDGQPAQATAVEIAIIKGRAEFNATFIVDGDTPFDRQDGEAILEKVAARLDKAKL